MIIFITTWKVQKSLLFICSKFIIDNEKYVIFVLSHDLIFCNRRPIFIYILNAFSVIQNDFKGSKLFIKFKTTGHEFGINNTLYKIKPNAPKISFQLDIQDIINTSFNSKHVIQRHHWWHFDIPKLIEEINWNRDSYVNGFFL